LFPNWSCQNVDNSVTVFGFCQNPFCQKKKSRKFPRSSGKLSHFDNLICFGINPFYHNAGQTISPFSAISSRIFKLTSPSPTHFVGNICGRSSIISQVRGRNDFKLSGPVDSAKCFNKQTATLYITLHKPKNHTPPRFSGDANEL